ncbi:MAG TPA: CHAT domain-containing tetratricopeptide repeat protein [Pyrinomonadaceae bacterium]|jgi:CHAT domain-containing protein|nr:CHAT domain-containing tetratricopeptide repeat protein [Pyrinomonadaceae bacterium]
MFFAKSKRACLIVFALCLSSSGLAQQGNETRSQAQSALVEKLAASLINARAGEERERLLAAAPLMLKGKLRDVLMSRVRISNMRRDFARSHALLQLVQTISERIGDDAGVVEALISSSIVYSMEGDAARVLQSQEQALKRSEASGNKAAKGYWLFATSGNTGGPAAQLDQLKRATALLLESGEKRGAAEALNLMGAMHYLRGDYDVAEEEFRQCLRLGEEVGVRDTISFALFHLGAVHRMKGDFALALEFYQRSLRLQEGYGPTGSLSSTLRHIGTTYYMMGNYRLALNYFAQCMRLDEMLKDETGTAWSLFYTGGVYRAQGLYADALDQLEKSRSLFEKQNYEDGTARVLGSLGSVYHALGRDELALDYLQRSLSLREKLEARDGVAATLLNIAIIYDSRQEHAQALETAARSAELARNTGNRDTLWRAVTIAGQSDRALNKPEQAVRAFDEAITTIEKIRAQVGGGEEEQELFFADKVSPYQQMVLMLLAQEREGEAFAYAERAKARVLLDVLREGRSDVTGHMTETERALERKLKGELVTLRTHIGRADALAQSEGTRLTELRERLDRTRLEYAAFQSRLYSAHPELKVQRGEVQPMTLVEVGDLVPDKKTALIEYVVTENDTILFVFTRAEVETARPSAKDAATVARQSAGNGAGQSLVLKVYHVDIKRKDLVARTERFRQQLAESNLLFSAEARALYDLLLKPAQEQLRDKTALVIVPDEVLWELPFQALQTSSEHYVLEDYAVSYAPSLTVLREIERRLARSGYVAIAPTLLAFGNPSTDQGQVQRARAPLMSEGFAPIPEAERQVRELAKLYGPLRSKVYTGTEAREERVKAEAGKYSILHLATHGVLNDASPLYSYVMLAQGPQRGGEDGILETWELMNMNLNAEMVVLSACETARGRISPGEGMIGLSWALFVAGSPTAVVSQWKVESASTTDLMLEFHRQLKSNAPDLSMKARTALPSITKAEALRRAALKLLRSERYAHPFYWAAFRLVGDGF